LRSEVSSRLTRLIEKHSQELAAGLTAELLRSERTSDFRKIPPDELQRTTGEVYRNLGEWLLRKTERDIEQRFRALPRAGPPRAWPCLNSCGP